MSYVSDVREDTKPNGPAAAAILAAGIGSFVLGAMVALVEAFPAKAGETSFFDFSKRYGIGSGVGPLSGKVIIAVAAYLVSWALVAYLWRGREVNFGRVFVTTLILLALGFALTFPPIFEVFAPA
jgi:hypothetical protein